MNKIKVSVAMATYNGSKYLKEQIDSILDQTHQIDELIISDDESNDDTLKIIKKYESNDKRVHLINGPKKGIKQNFANAIKNTTGDIIFLSDQDDVWMNNKVEKVLKEFEDNDCILVIHNADIVDENLNATTNDIFSWRRSGAGIMKNIFKNTYVGCCIAFKSELKEHILPIPDDIEMHDQWIGVLGNKYGNNIFLNDKLIKYRRHTNNSSSLHHHTINLMIRNRINFIKNYFRRTK